MRLRIFSLLSVIIIVCIGLVSQYCTHDSNLVNDLPSVCFDTEVLPVFLASCATVECHDATAQDGYRFDTYEGIMKGIDPGLSSGSEIYRAIISRGEDRMPPDHPLSREARMTIRIWIDQGAGELLCYDPVPPDTIPDSTWSNPLVCFERDILPIFQTSCATTNCHDNITRLEGYDFTTYGGIMEEISPGNPFASKIYEKITEDEPEDIMPPPPFDPLTRAQIDSIYRWILLGAKDEECGEKCDTLNVGYASHIEPLITTYCIGCHSGASPSGGVLLNSYSNVVAQVNAGKLPGVIKRDPPFNPMPPAMALSVCDVRTVEIWIENGALND